MTTLEEAIKHCEEVAEEQEEKAKEGRLQFETWDYISKCEECASDHRQLAEWLRELQDFKALFVKANRDVGNVHLDNRAIFEKFFWDCWRIFKAEVEVQKNDT